MSTPHIDNAVSRYKEELRRAKERGRVVEPLGLRREVIPDGAYIQMLAARYRESLERAERLRIFKVRARPPISIKELELLKRIRGP